MTSRKQRRPVSLVATAVIAASATLAFCAGPATANFEPADNYSNGTGPNSVVAGYFNGDAYTDFAFTTTGGTVSVMTGSADGQFSLSNGLFAGESAASITAGDLDGDGKQDLVFVKPGSGNIATLIGNGDGTFVPGSIPPAAPGSGPSDVVIANMGGTARPDLVWTNRAANTVSVSLQDGSGNFGVPSSLSTGAQPSSLAVGRFDADADLDVVVANSGSGNISIFPGNGDGTLAAPTLRVVGTAPSSVSVASFGDSVNDHFADIAVANAGSDNVTVFPGKGDGTFKSPSTQAVGDQPLSISTGNLNGGIGTLISDDIVSANPGSGTISLLGGTGDGVSFWQPAFSYPDGTAPSSIATGDFNNDTVPDLVTTDPVENVVSVRINKGPEPVLNTDRIEFPDTKAGTESDPEVFSISNGSDMYWLPVTHTEISGPDASSFRFRDSNCEDFVVGPGGCSMQIHFKPTSPGFKLALVSVTHPGPGGDYTALLSGTGLEADPPGPVCPDGLDLKIAGFDPAPPYGDADRVSGLRVRVSAKYRRVLAGMTPWIGYRSHGQVTRVALAHRNVVINGARNFRFLIPREIRQAILSDGRSLRGARVQFVLRSKVAPLGTPECSTGIQVQNLRLPIAGISGRAGLRSLPKP